MTDLLEKFYRQDLHTVAYQERKFVPPPHSFVLCGVTLSGKTALIKRYLLQKRKSTYLYIDCSDIRIDPAAFNKHIGDFCLENAIGIIVLDNYTSEFTVPDAKQVILVTRTPMHVPPFKQYTLFPLDFEEFLAYERRYDESALNDFLQLGGFAVLHKTPAEERALVLQRSLSLALSETEFDVMVLAARLHTQKVSAFMLYERLRSQRKISKDMLYRSYESLISQGYLYTLAKYGHPRAVKKLYLCDIALRNALHFQKHFGRLFENLVLSELVKHYGEIFYGEQVDFYLHENNRVVLCMPFSTRDILFKRIENIEAFIVTHGVKKVDVITMSSEAHLQHPFVEVEMIPFSAWALSEGE